MAEEETEPTLPTERAAELIEKDEVQLVDVREDDEWEAGHIPGARHIPLNELTEQVETIERGKPVVFYCRGDGRSGMAAEAFRTAGFEAMNIERGIVGWVESGREIEPPNGEIVDHAGFPPK